MCVEKNLESMKGNSLFSVIQHDYLTWLIHF